MSVNYTSFNETSKPKLSKFAFVDPDNWQNELENLNKRSPDLDRLIYPDSMLISSILDQLVNLIIGSFIKPWYKSINQSKYEADDLFTDEVKISIKYAIASLYLKLSGLDFTNLMVLRLVPIITDHFNNFVSAKASIRKKYLLSNSNSKATISGLGISSGVSGGKNTKRQTSANDKLLNLTDESQINLLISQFYNHGKLHDSVNSFRENSQFSTFSQKAHLRAKLNKILPLILEKNEISCSPVNLLIREIVINCVFLPVVNMVVDPDFWNQMIVDKIGSTLKDRTKVIQLRAELQKHSKNATKGKKAKKNDDSSTQNGSSTSNKKKNQDNTLFEFKLGLSTTQSLFEKFLKKINKNTSIVDLRQLKFYINLQLQKTLRNDDYKHMSKEFSEHSNDQNNKSEAVKKNKDLYERYKILVKRLQIVQLTLTNRINNLNFENQTNNLDNSSIHSAQTGSSKNVGGAPEKINLSLLTILNDSSLLTYYMEYMDQHGKTILLQFWLVVNGIKNPLEDSMLINTDDIYAEDTLMDANLTGVNDAEINQNLNFANDIKSIFINYFNSKLIIENNKVVYENVESFVKAYDSYKSYLEAYRKFNSNGASEETNKKDLELYNDYELYNKKFELNKLFVRARKSILILQAKAYKYMESDLPIFKNSNVYLKLIASENNRLGDTNNISGNPSYQNLDILDNRAHSRSNSNISTLGAKHDETTGDPLANYNTYEDNSNTIKGATMGNHDYNNVDTENGITGLSNSISSLKNMGGAHDNKIFNDNDDLVVSYDVINAVEHALNEIIENNNDYKSSDAVKLKNDILEGSLKDNANNDDEVDSDASSGKTGASSRLFGAYKDIFGQSSLLFKGDFARNSNSDNESKKDDCSSGLSTLVESNVRDRFLFDNDEEINDIDDMDSVISEMINSETIGEYESTEVHLAAPGDLNLAEEIEKLTNDIESLNNQVQILQPLLKKAELTNNTAELRILRKANVSLQREVQLKELQRQQYIVQENDNSLFGKSRVGIQSYIISNDEKSGKEYTSYIIEVQKISTNEGADNQETVSAGWIVARRFSQFYLLNKYLRSIYPKVKLLNFPKKNVILMNQAQQKVLIETRRQLLEVYLKELLKMPDVCKSRIFRLFLSSQNFNSGILANKRSPEYAKVKNSPTLNSSVDDVGGISNKYKAIEDVTAKLYNGITNGIEYLNGSLIFSNANAQNAGLTNGLSKLDEDGMDGLSRGKNGYKNSRAMNGAAVNEDTGLQSDELQNELNSYDDDKTTFVKPICDLFLSIFALNRSNSWLRGRAILVILQQLLGSTIEKKIREYLSVIKTENKVIDLLNIFRDKLWPNNVFFLTLRAESGETKQRTELEKKNTKDESRTLLEIIITDISSKIVGLNNSKFAAAEIHNMLQNDILNTHLIYSLIDELLDALFPEVSNVRTNSNTGNSGSGKHK
ncbi:Mdm1 protein [Saccharomycopsis crataegensis]|uniref:Mdm1 protein n=1 Tax=Saccharomycopsis crataegensis TaxID=43959 RepID=A0AAV5QFD9_9ASCO|nr:Mdm1 protein [Saccharomycopsis crataegensis]